MLIEITCRACGQPYQPTAEDFRRGPEVYQRCPDCRPANEAEMVNPGRVNTGVAER